MYGAADHSTCHVAAATGAKTATPTSVAAAPAPSGSPARAIRRFQPAWIAAAARASARAAAGTRPPQPPRHPARAANPATRRGPPPPVSRPAAHVAARERLRPDRLAVPHRRAHDHRRPAGQRLERLAGEVVPVCEAVKRRVDIRAGVGDELDPADLELGARRVAVAARLPREEVADDRPGQAGVGRHAVDDGVGELDQRQWSGGSHPSRTDGFQSAPTVREPATHEPSWGCGNLQCFSLIWTPYEFPDCRWVISTLRAISFSRPSGMG